VLFPTSAKKEPEQEQSNDQNDRSRGGSLKSYRVHFARPAY
jgi:hypothetical protein